MRQKIKKILKVLIIILIACFFLPAFTVSCGNVTENVSAAHAMVGFEDATYGTISEADPFVALILIIPIIMMIVGRFKKEFKKSEGITNIILAILELILYAALKKEVENFARQNMCNYSVGIAYVLEIVINISCIIGYLLLLVGFGKTTGEYIMQSEPNGWKCTCGKVNASTSRFCSSCGNQKPIEMNTADVQSVSEGKWVCSCGNILNNDSLFCGKCGNKKPD